jgi:hypothetical protein
MTRARSPADRRPQTSELDFLTRQRRSASASARLVSAPQESGSTKRIHKRSRTWESSSAVNCGLACGSSLGTIRSRIHLECMAGTTGLEPATSAVTGQRSDQLSYVPTSLFRHLEVCHIESSVSQKSLNSLVSTFSLPWTRFWAPIDTKQTPRRHQNRHCNDRNKSIR